MATESDRRGGGPCGGREDEPERRTRGKRRTLNVQLPAETVERVERDALGSGLTRTHFLATALVMGSRALGEQLSGLKRG